MLEAECGRSNRRSKVLVGPWRFQIDQDDRGEQGLWFATDNITGEWGTAEVPGPWDLFDHALWGYEGIGWYATEIDGDDVVAESWQQLIFGRVNMHAKVWLNGHLLGEHIGGHLPFEFAVTQYLHDDGLNRLVIRVSNVPRVEWLPGSEAIEWVLYGGILQPIVLLTTDQTYISDLQIVAEPGRAHAKVTCYVEVTNRADADFGGRIKIGIPVRDGTVACEAVVECSAHGSSVTTVGLEIPDAVLWSPQNPHLYSAEVSLRSDGTLVDQIDDQFGVRTVQVRGSEILLNGQPVFLKGVNRYDEYVGYGPTVPADVVRDDLLAIKRTGANMV
ncbi:MAG: hypothetical protein MUQ10_10480, partial [Anaerolineae bacterium]|nr:hypothetical protein [Anaerolineae bacterium]